jgi:hypothetical protein
MIGLMIGRWKIAFVSLVAHRRLRDCFFSSIGEGRRDKDIEWRWARIFLEIARKAR